MSFQAINLVWEHSKSKGSARVIMLALADHANEKLQAYPSLDRLARYANIDRRNVIDAIDKLIGAQEIVKVGHGRRNVNIYKITLTSDENITSDASITSDADVTTTGDAGITRTGDAGITRTTSEPSLIPYKDIEPVKDDPQVMVSLWNTMAADCHLPIVSKLTEARRIKARARLKDCGGIEGWKAALGKVRASPFLSGVKTDFKTSFDWLVKPANFTKVIEGNYNNVKPNNADYQGPGDARPSPQARFAAAAFSVVNSN